MGVLRKGKIFILNNCVRFKKVQQQEGEVAP